MTTFVVPYNRASKSAKAIADGLGVKRLRLEGSRVRASHEHTFINWGLSRPHPVSQGAGWTINPWQNVAIASNKYRAFALLEENGVNVPFYCEFSNEWDINGGEEFPVVVRETLRGHSGEGIVILNTREEWNNYDHSRAQMYVQYVKKTHEYRVHVVAGKVVDIRRKGRRQDVADDDVNWQVRNYANGFVYMRELGHIPHPQVEEQALRSIVALGLDFGAVDIIWNERQQKAYVLEVNTAPGLEGSTIRSYVEAFKEMLK